MSYAMVNKMPDTVDIHDHLFPFVGAEPDPKFLWGLYGTTSINQGLFMADAWATKHKKQLLTVQMWYRVDNFDRVRSQINQEIAEESGFLHLDRLKTDYREELRQFVLGEMKVDMTNSQMIAASEQTLEDLMLRYPKYVRSILAANRKINVVVHPVRPTYDPNDSKTVHVATVRAIKARIMAAEVRYIERIKVTY